ncbi:DUF3310 domain-containing protein [Suicoccus acidiformans]|nr:DUF3310 domain-containing protein [Suicoccus acidiformans]
MKQKVKDKIIFLFKELEGLDFFDEDSLLKSILIVIDKDWPEAPKPTSDSQPRDAINKPKHYIGRNGIEVDEVSVGFLSKIKDGYVGHKIGTAVEYLLRASEKNQKEDIQKAHKNLEMLLDYLNKEGRL